MSPSPGDDLQSTQDSKTSGGLASVFKGLAGAAKLTKPHPTPMQHTGTLLNAQIAERLSSSPTTAHGLPQRYIESFETLKDGALSDRIAAAHVLRVVVADYPLNPVLDIWYAAKDLIEPTNARTTRTAGWELLTACVKHPSSTDIERREYFQTVTCPANPEDFHLQLAALSDLTNHGRDVSGFDYEIFSLLSTWLQFAFESVRAARNAARKQGTRSKEKGVFVQEDRSLTELFDLVIDTIKFNFVVAGERAIEALVDTLLNICNHSSSSNDLQACISTLDAIITFGALPLKRMKSCVEILCSIHCLVEALQKNAWHSISILCRSHNGQAVVRMLLDVLHGLSAGTDRGKEGLREVRGVLSVLAILMSKSSIKGYPIVPYSLLVDGLSKVVEVTSSWKIHCDVLKLANVLLEDTQGNVNTMLADEDWTPILEIAASSSAGVVTLISKSDEGIAPLLAKSETENPESYIAKQLATLINRLENVMINHEGVLIQRQECILFFARVHPAIPDTAAILILNYFREFRCCFPSDSEWEKNLTLVLEAFFSNKRRSTDVRLQALHNITDVYDMVELLDGQIEPGFMPRLMKRLLSGITEEADPLVLQEIVSFAVTVATAADLTLFGHITNALGAVANRDQMHLPTTPATAQLPRPTITTETPVAIKSQTTSCIVTRGFVQLFMRVMNEDVAKAKSLFIRLISIAKSNDCETDARVTAMQLLFRLRADWANRLFVTSHTEIAHLASTLYHTKSSVSRKSSEENSQPMRLSRSEMASSTRSSRGISFSGGLPQDRMYTLRTASTTKTSLNSYQPLWTASDADALPEAPAQAASLVLSSDTRNAPSSEIEKTDGSFDDGVLPMGQWLDAVLHMMQHGCDWEVYSFVLVHLPSQLSNHAIFRRSVPQLQDLRRTVCDQIRLNSFSEPPLTLGLRKADVAICLFHTLTMILSYHRHFQKPEEDEIVRTFVHGIATWERSAKCCIHALTICCHELPQSTSKALVTILQRMAQIITQPYVAMHILEFLACLSRLPSLYVNFREDEYRIVFGISFRYLQYVRGRKSSHRPSMLGDSFNPSSAIDLDSVHPNASDDLPQYVYTLAYHVILFWFLALKLPDRANHVGWIAKNLFTDVDGSYVTEEQAQVTIDFMQRVTYADVDESAADPFFTPDRFGEILKKRWLIGNSIVTIEQAISTGWAQITKRQPSGTSSYTIRELFRPPPLHQESFENSSNALFDSANSVLPSHLLVQLLSSMPQGIDAGRPIPLPDDEGVNRAIRMFDHSSTVDGHKVGVIYIGEHQTSEADILANISGSSDYLEFLDGLGTLTKLKGATFNTQGLDRQYDTDGEYTFCWRDRVTELVFHVTTQMPTNREEDPRCTLKKRHIGNDFVNIIFNDSGLPFKFDTFPSEFNYVNIVITPESRASFVASRQRTTTDMPDPFYKVQVMSKPGFPEISPASETKIVSLKALPGFIRLLALNASVFSLVWANREGGEHVSSWRNRLKAINRLRERHGPKISQGPAPSPPGTALSQGNATLSSGAPSLEVSKAGNTVRDSFSSLRRSSVATFFSNSSEQNSHRSSMLSTATTDNTEVMTTNGAEALVDTIDYSKWA